MTSLRHKNAVSVAILLLLSLLLGSFVVVVDSAGGHQSEGVVSGTTWDNSGVVVHRDLAGIKRCKNKCKKKFENDCKAKCNKRKSASKKKACRNRCTNSKFKCNYNCYPKTCQNDCTKAVKKCQGRCNSNKPIGPKRSNCKVECHKKKKETTNTCFRECGGKPTPAPTQAPEPEPEPASGP